MKSKKEILKQFKKHCKISKSALGRQYKHFDECQAFYSGDYMAYRDDYRFGRGVTSRIKEVQFNRVKPYVNSIVGFMAQQRRKPDYQAVIQENDVQVAYSEYINGYSDYIRENANADQMETAQDKDMLIGGVGVTDTAITLKDGNPSRDPNGEIIIERVNPKEVGWDPNAVHPNLLDSRWAYRVKDYDLDDAIDLFDANEEDFEFVNQDDYDDADYQFNPYGGIQDKIGFEYSDANREMIRVYFYQWCETESYYRIENPIFAIDNIESARELAFALSQVEQDKDDELFMFKPDAETLTITKENRTQVKEIFEMFGIPFKPVNEKRKVFYSAVISGDKCFSAYKSVSQQGFSLKFKTGDRDETSKIWTGIVASLRDPQRYYNKSLTELMLIIASNSRGGIIHEAGAIDDIQSFERNWARHNARVEVAEGALSGGKIQPKATPQQPTGYENILGLSSDALSQVTGIDESFFGAIGSGNETAMLQRQRIKQASTILVVYMDSILLYTKEQARLMMSFIRLLAESMGGSLFRTQDDDGNTIFERISTDFIVDEYDIRIGEAPDTPTQQEYYTQTLIQMGQSMQAIGDPKYTQMYAAAIAQMPFGEREKNKIINILSGEQQYSEQQLQQILAPLQQQLEAMQSNQAQLQMASVQANIEKTAAETADKLAEVRKKEAQTEEIVEIIEQKSLENDLMALKGPEDVNVTI
jgi:hypothetical protein